LRGSFKPSEFERFLKLRGFAEVAEAVSQHAGVAEYFSDVVEALDHRGRIDAEFFDRLAEERPAKEAQVKSLETFWLAEERLEDLARQVKSGKTLVELVCCIGKAVVQAGYQKHQADRACAQYLESYEQRYAQVKILGMAEPVPLASIYTEVRIVPPTFLRGYRTQEELQEEFIRKRRSLAGYDFSREIPRPGLNVANDERYRFLNLLGAPGAGKSTFLHYIGWMALQSYRPSKTVQGSPNSAAARYRFNLLPV